MDSAKEKTTYLAEGFPTKFFLQVSYKLFILYQIIT